VVINGEYHCRHEASEQEDWVLDPGCCFGGPACPPQCES
jgi:hypothetical protein